MARNAQNRPQSIFRARAEGIYTEIDLGQSGAFWKGKLTMEIREAIEGFRIDNAMLVDSGNDSVIERNNLAIKALEIQAENKNGWIPCSERLPEDNQTVIFTDKCGNVDAGVYEAKKNWCVNDSYFPNAFSFVAWQPLPKPYKPQ